jgi:hypothetical protein
MELSDLVPALTALVGALGGATLALSRFKSERAFDRRLQWYEDMTEHLHKLGATLERAINESEKGRVDNARASLAEVKQLYIPFAVLGGLRTVYAKQGGADAVQRLIDHINRIGALTKTIPAEEKAQANWEILKGFKDGMWATAAVLADEIRSDLGWSKLARRPRQDTTA